MVHCGPFRKKRQAVQIRGSSMWTARMIDSLETCKTRALHVSASPQDSNVGRYVARLHVNPPMFKRRLTEVSSALGTGASRSLRFAKCRARNPVASVVLALTVILFDCVLESDGRLGNRSQPAGVPHRSISWRGSWVTGHMANEGDAARPKTRFSWRAQRGSRCARRSGSNASAAVFAFGMKMCGDPDDAQEVRGHLLSHGAIGARFPGRGLRFRPGSTNPSHAALHQEAPAYQGSARAPRAARCGPARAVFRAGTQARTDTARPRDAATLWLRPLDQLEPEAREG